MSPSVSEIDCIICLTPTIISKLHCLHWLLTKCERITRTFSSSQVTVAPPIITSTYCYLIIFDISLYMSAFMFYLFIFIRFGTISSFWTNSRANIKYFWHSRTYIKYFNGNVFFFFCSFYFLVVFECCVFPR